jgi:hypothetical protein
VRYAGKSFDICLQDDSSGSTMQINSTTGDYQFSDCKGLTLDGAGTLTKKGNIISLQHNAGDRRLIAKIDTGLNKAIASLQVFSPAKLFTITDRNITNNTCSGASQ